MDMENKFLPNQTSFIDDEDITQFRQCDFQVEPSVEKLTEKQWIEKGHAVWHEYEGMQHAPVVDKNKFGSHEWIGPEDATSDCKYGCGCWMGPSRSGGPVNPWGACPNNRKVERVQPIIDDEKKTTFAKELENLLKRYSNENESDTPDWILAEHIRKTLETWNSSVLKRDKWYGHKTLTRG
jgi:hypothetical protein